MDSEPGVPAPDDDTQPPFDSSIVALLAVLVAVVTITAVALVAMQDGPGPTGADRDSPVPPPRLSAAFDVAYPGENGPFGQTWRWMGTRGKVTTKGAEGEHYLAFRALSVEGPRKLFVGGERPIRLDELPRSFIVGPLETGGRTVGLRASPGAQRISRKDRRQVSAFLANPRLVAEPVAALPGKGFYQEEQLPNGATFQWLSNQGVVDVLTKRTAMRNAVVTLTLRSPVRRRATARVEDGAPARPVTLGADTIVRMTVRVPMRAGRGRFRVAVDPGPKRVSDVDPRALGAQLLRVTAAPGPPTSP